MIPLTATSKQIDSLLRETARCLFDFISPKILLVGEWDSHYEVIHRAYQWATHTKEAPLRFDDDLALIVVNSRALFNTLVLRVSDDTAILLYDENELIPVSERNIAKPTLLCYLNKISPKYLPGHIRVLLQLRKALVCVEDSVPYLLASDDERIEFRGLIRTLDKGDPGYVIVSQADYFFTVFKETVQLSHYESVLFVEHPDHFNEIVTAKPTTLILQVKSKAQFDAYQAKPLERYSIVYVGARRYWSGNESQCYTFPELGSSEDTFLLTSYYESMQQNLSDEQHRTRFIQVYTIRDVMEKHKTISTYLPAIRKIFDAHNVKFRNIPIRVWKANYCVYPLDDLLLQFSDEMKKELLNQTDHSLYSMEMVTGIVRSTLIVRYHLR